ncbi:SUF system NifU family Fe-S cluster assembly protein [Candidatus Woesearchaeota archaeon]|nr:SUF system NifU family Fe-S cluster assembly protein [Candidatus Woesearchaeota archaeon]
MEDDLYAENILDHYNNPRNFGIPKKFDLNQQEINPLCGDEINIYLTLDNKKIKDIKFSGSGCAISQASASIISEHIKGKEINEVKSYGKEDILNLLGISIGPVRLKCALLSLKAIQKSIQKSENESNIKN